MPRPTGEETLEAAPDLLMATARDWLRPSWSIPVEGKAPEFVLEASSGRSWLLDRKQKPLIYDGMGVQEYVLFAPERADGSKLLGWRQSSERRRKRQRGWRQKAGLLRKRPLASRRRQKQSSARAVAPPAWRAGVSGHLAIRTARLGLPAGHCRDYYLSPLAPGS